MLKDLHGLTDEPLCLVPLGLTQCFHLVFPFLVLGGLVHGLEFVGRIGLAGKGLPVLEPEGLGDVPGNVDVGDEGKGRGIVGWEFVDPRYVIYDVDDIPKMLTEQVVKTIPSSGEWRVPTLWKRAVVLLSRHPNVGRVVGD